MQPATKPAEPDAELDDLARRVIGAAIDVHRSLGPGFSEAIYEEALCIELVRRQLPFARQVPVEVYYKGHSVGQARLDLLVAERLVVELKAVPQLRPVHRAQVISYLAGMKQPLGLLINFQVALLPSGIRRVVFSKSSAG
jgi:GxxExxY protein